MSGKFPKSYSYYLLSMTIVMFASLLLRVWGNFPSAPTLVKFIFSLSIWFALMLFPWSWIRLNDFSKIGKFLLNSMLLWGVFEIIRSLLFPGPELKGMGNRYLTLFFNEYCALIFLPPIYAYTVTKYNILPFIIRISLKYIYGGIVIGIGTLSLYCLSNLSVYLIVFWRYVNSYLRRFILITYSATFIYAVFGARKYFIFCSYAIAAYLLCYRWNKKQLQKILCVVSIISPIVCFLPLFSVSADAENSSFKKILNYVGGNDDKEMKADTRTFLYLEMAVDLTQNNAWITGKGANSRYYSQYFSQISDGDSSNRLISEVPFLLFILRGGLIYSTIYLCFFFVCIYKSVWTAKSKFINCIGIMLAGWFANLFVGDVNGCNFYHLILFSLCGLTLSRRWLNMSDYEIVQLINAKSLIKI